jgi:hypothetical protein
MNNAASAFAAADVVFIGKVVKISNTKIASVGLVVKEAGTLELVKVPYWEKSYFPTRIVTLEVTEVFKGNAAQTFVLTSAPYDHGATCGVNFKKNENFLVYAHKLKPYLSAGEPGSAEHDSKELQLNTEANKFNQRLPAFVTTICSRTERMRWANDDVKIIRRLRNAAQSRPFSMSNLTDWPTLTRPVRTTVP